MTTNNHDSSSSVSSNQSIEPKVQNMLSAQNLNGKKIMSSLEVQPLEQARSRPDDSLSQAYSGLVQYPNEVDERAIQSQPYSIGKKRHLPNDLSAASSMRSDVSEERSVSVPPDSS